MKTFKSSTKIGRRYIDSYNRATASTLSDVYGRYSYGKAHAERWCKEQMIKESGNGFKIISFNTFGFSCAWMVADGLRIETPQNSYLVAF